MEPLLPCVLPPSARSKGGTHRWGLPAQGERGSHGSTMQAAHHPAAADLASRVVRVETGHLTHGCCSAAARAAEAERGRTPMPRQRAHVPWTFDRSVGPPARGRAAARCYTYLPQGSIIEEEESERRRRCAIATGDERRGTPRSPGQRLRIGRPARLRMRRPMQGALAHRAGAAGGSCL